MARRFGRTVGALVRGCCGPCRCGAVDAASSSGHEPVHDGSVVGVA